MNENWREDKSLPYWICQLVNSNNGVRKPFLGARTKGWMFDEKHQTLHSLKVFIYKRSKTENK
jgi:hypothetical protein